MQALSQPTHHCLISTIKSIVPKLNPLRRLYQLRYSSENLLGIQAQICEQVQDILQCLEKIQVEPCCIEAKVEDVRQFLSKENDFLWAEEKASKLIQKNQRSCGMATLKDFTTTKNQLPSPLRALLESPVYESNKYQYQYSYQQEYEQELGLKGCLSCEMHSQQNYQKMEEQQVEAQEKIVEQEEKQGQEQEQEEQESGRQQQQEEEEQEQAPDYSHVFDN